MDYIEFCFCYGIIKEVPFMFGAALLDCLNLNNITNIEQIKKELVSTGKTAKFEIKSERKILEVEQDSSLASFKYKKRRYYLVWK